MCFTATDVQSTPCRKTWQLIFIEQQGDKQPGSCWRNTSSLDTYARYRYIIPCSFSASQWHFAPILPESLNSGNAVRSQYGQLLSSSHQIKHSFFHSKWWLKLYWKKTGFYICFSREEIQYSHLSATGQVLLHTSSLSLHCSSGECCVVRSVFFCRLYMIMWQLFQQYVIFWPMPRKPNEPEF